MSHDGCEWDPAGDRLAYDTDEHSRSTPATIIVGANGMIRLCASCAALPRFRRYRSRIPIRATPNATTPAEDGPGRAS